MDWNGNENGAVPFVSGHAGSSFGCLFNYDLHYSVPIPAGTEMMHPMMTVQTQEGVETMQIMEMNNFANNSNNNVEEKRKKKKKKKKLTSEQLGSLESSFQEEIKLEPDRKMKLAQEIGIDPRQVAVWFQNRRARWKTKQLECSYRSLKHQLHLVSKENQMLQHEVRELRAVLNEEATKKQVSADICVESTYRPWGTASNNQNQGDHQHNFVFNVHDNNQERMMPYWGVMPSYP